MSLSSLKKGSSLDKLKKAVEASSAGNGGGKNVDDRFWQPEVDAAGNGYAVIRFLDTPAVDGEDGLPWVQIWSHGFQGPGGWYIENSLTTLGKTDPVSEYNTVLWNSGVEANKEIARKQKRKLTYIANVLVISDAKRPQNEGKVVLFKFGKKIFDKIKEQLELESPAALLDGDDAKIEQVWKSAHSLKDFLKADNFKSYDELQAKLNKVLGAGGTAGATAKRIDDEQTDAPVVRSAPAKKVTAEDVSVDDDDMAFFEKLAAE